MSDTLVKSKLRIAREAEGLSREKVAAHLDVSSKTVERDESNGNRVPRVRLRKYALLYRVKRLSELEEAAA